MLIQICKSGLSIYSLKLTSYQHLTNQSQSLAFRRVGFWCYVSMMTCQKWIMAGLSTHHSAQVKKADFALVMYVDSLDVHRT